MVFILDTTAANEGRLANFARIELIWLPPTDWAPTDPRLITFDDGTGHTFPAHAFLPGDTIGVQIARNGGSVNDKWTGNLNLAGYAALTYTTRCSRLNY